MSSRRRPAALLVVLALTLALTPRAEAFVYWTTGKLPQRTIGRANLDGTGVNTNFIVQDPGGLQCGLAVDDSHIYWLIRASEERPGSIGRAKLDGTDVDESFIVDVGSAPTSPGGCGLAVDSKHVYWTKWDGDDTTANIPGSGSIGRAKLDVTDVDESFISGVNFPGAGVAVDPFHLYWTSWATPDDLYPGRGPIARANVDGTDVEQAFRPATIADALAVDDAHIWWARSGVRGGGCIGRANLDGTGAEGVICGEAFNPGGLAVDDTHVYWGGPSTIGRAKLDGTRANHQFITTGEAPAEGWGYGSSLAVDALGPRPSNAFAFGRAKKNRKRGTAKLAMKVPGPGDLELAKTKKVKRKEKGADAAGRVKFPIKPRRKAKKRLAAKGKAKVKVKVTYAPDGGEPNTQSKRVKLIKRR